MHVETRMGEYALQHTTVGCLVRAIHYLMAALEMTDAELNLALEMLREGINAGS